MKKSNITAFIEVFNEEERIESCLKSFSWVDEIILFDKHSTDRTREIAEKYATEIVLVPFCDGSENIVNNITGRPSSEWCLFPTASSLMHPDLADEIIKLTCDPNFEFDVIGMPYGMYSFGIRSSKSPFSALYKNTLIKRSKLKVSTQLHNEISFSSKKIFKMPLIHEEAVLYHCTHKNAESFWGHVTRYAKYEAKHDASLTVTRTLLDILKAIFTVLFRRHTFLLGMDGIALSLGYIGYFVERFMFVWDRSRENGDVVYPALRNKIDSLWDSRNIYK